MPLTNILQAAGGLFIGEKVCLNPLIRFRHGSIARRATVFGLFAGTDFGIVFGAFAGALFVATMPQALSTGVWRRIFLVSFIIGVLGAEVLASWLVRRTQGFNGAPVDAFDAGGTGISVVR